VYNCSGSSEEWCKNKWKSKDPGLTPQPPGIH
jgi:hypothetical protein